MRIQEYFDKDVRDFSLYDCHRSIADVRDGFKPVQRKIIYGIQKGYGENKESLQVSRLVGIITSTSGYHHGECLASNTKLNLYGFSISIQSLVDNFQGFKNSKDLLIASYDIDNKFNCYSEILSAFYTKSTNEWVEVEVDNDIICTTLNHKFLTKSNEWIEAKDLREEDELLSFMQTSFKVKSLKINYDKNDIREFYDLTIKDTSCFSIGNSQIIVHNSSCEKAVVNMAQNFSGANNMNLLEPDGQFGSRLSSESGASRYIRTKFSSNFRKLFLKDDEIILNYKKSEDDGTEIEPETYYPILPVILINGHEGIGTGFAMNVLAYNPEDLKKQILNYISSKKIKEILPWYKDFKGTIEKIDESIVIKGVIEKVNLTTLKITELPIGVYQDDYKEFLNKLEDSGVIKDYEDNSTEKSFEFIIKTTKDIASLEEEKLLEKFKLIKKKKENLTFWINNKELKKFESISEVIEWWTNWRLEIYTSKIKKKIDILTNDLDYNKEKIRFIELYLSNSKEFSKKNKEQIETLLKKEKFKEDHISDFLSIRIYNLTKDAIEKLKEEIKVIETELKYFKKVKNTELMEKDLGEFKC